MLSLTHLRWDYHYRLWTFSLERGPSFSLLQQGDEIWKRWPYFEYVFQLFRFLLFGMVLHFLTCMRQSLFTCLGHLVICYHSNIYGGNLHLLNGKTLESGERKKKTIGNRCFEDMIDSVGKRSSTQSFENKKLFVTLSWCMMFVKFIWLCLGCKLVVLSSSYTL